MRDIKKAATSAVKPFYRTLPILVGVILLVNQDDATYHSDIEGLFFYILESSTICVPEFSTILSILMITTFPIVSAIALIFSRKRKK